MTSTLAADGQKLLVVHLVGTELEQEVAQGLPSPVRGCVPLVCFDPFLYPLDDHGSLFRGCLLEQRDLGIISNIDPAEVHVPHVDVEKMTQDLRPK